ncbi:MAG: hypothetical protein QXL01_00290 [Thermoplasmatales archaeon]
MSEDDQEPNEQWFFSNPIYFPWHIMNLDRPRVGPLHGYLCTICARYEKHPGFKTYLSGPPHWGSIKKFATEPLKEDTNIFIEAIYKYCSIRYEKSASDRRDVDIEVVGFLEGFQEFRNDFYKRLLTLWRNGRLYLNSAQLRNKRIVRQDDYGDF